MSTDFTSFTDDGLDAAFKWRDRKSDELIDEMGAILDEKKRRVREAEAAKKITLEDIVQGARFYDTDGNERMITAVGGGPYGIVDTADGFQFWPWYGGPMCTKEQMLEYVNHWNYTKEPRS